MMLIRKKYKLSNGSIYEVVFYQGRISRASFKEYIQKNYWKRQYSSVNHHHYWSLRQEKVYF